MTQPDPAEGLKYYPCRYDTSRIQFRGPRVSLDGPYTAVVGGSEVYGKYVDDPFTDQLAERTGRRVVNLGILNGGLDAFVLDDGVLRVLANAETVVVQAMGAHNMSNRYYTVHPRRNDRFLKQSSQMTQLFRDVDFSDFSFTRHMLSSLKARSPGRFAKVEAELQKAWVARMRLLFSRIPGKRVLLMIENNNDRGLGPEPLFVTIDMLQELEGSIDRVVQCDVSDTMSDASLDEMTFPEKERDAAGQMLTPEGHARVAEALAKAVRRSNGLAA
ncbi:DUF6473 family protein [Jannaschia pohangensis]|uniref:DUF6473 domain-containing protein n=1 Tax=Jannaschia pohangensis TaxID=390807 RepID=A0A1I3LFE4_9RHOB|nr:DUF6473 family protein [Jannaschia pohangensis]SFI83483.1 hypothetical protein SAMN04488095_1505 [Jannaschia pohangensis]